MTPNELGDECHRDLLNVSDIDSTEVFVEKHFNSSSILLCINGITKSITKTQYQTLKAFVKSMPI